MNTMHASSLIAIALTSACATGPVNDDGGFPSQVTWGQPAFPQKVADVPLIDGGEFPAPVIAGSTKFIATIADVPYHAAGEFPPAVHVVRTPVAPIARAGAKDGSTLR